MYKVSTDDDSSIAGGVVYVPPAPVVSIAPAKAVTPPPVLVTEPPVKSNITPSVPYDDTIGKGFYTISPPVEEPKASIIDKAVGFVTSIFSNDNTELSYAAKNDAAAAGGAASAISATSDKTGLIISIVGLAALVLLIKNIND